VPRKRIAVARAGAVAFKPHSSYPPLARMIPAMGA
jgi:hypothetical protein